VDQRVKEPTRTRRYHAPRRRAAAAETRQAILQAAKEEFEERGWAATTMRSLAERAGVSPKTVEALFATKPALLEATLLTVLGGDAANTDSGDVVRPEGLLELRSEAAREMERAPSAATMLELQSALATEMNARSARIYWAFETAVWSDERLAAMWARLTEAQLFAIGWTAKTLLQKPGVRADLTLPEAEENILTASDWNTYRTLTTKLGMTADEFQAWMQRYYRRVLLA
jgi:AcrR family transcriptional regulator